MLTEQDLLDLDFSQHTMAGTGWNSISSMQDAIYYYKRGRVCINATEIWTWFLDGEQRNDISVNTKESLKELVEQLEKDNAKARQI